MMMNTLQVRWVGPHLTLSTTMMLHGNISRFFQQFQHKRFHLELLQHTTRSDPENLSFPACYHSSWSALNMKLNSFKSQGHISSFQSIHAFSIFCFWDWLHLTVWSKCVNIEKQILILMSIRQLSLERSCLRTFSWTPWLHEVTLICFLF